MNQTKLAQLNHLPTNTTSPISAVQYLNSMDFDEGQYREMLADLTDTKVDGTEPLVKFTYQYVVQSILKTDSADIEECMLTAKKFIQKNGWVTIKPEYSSSYTPKSTVDACGNPKQKKGKKKEKAIKFYKANQDQDWTRKVWIEKLMEEIGLSKAGASTYHYNLKKGIYK